MYCTYLTVYSGNRLPPFYIGYSTVSKVENGYRGSAQSKLYGSLWKSELKNNPHLFKTKIITTHHNKEDAILTERKFHLAFSVHINPMFINQSASHEKFHNSGGYKLTEQTKKNMSRAKTGVKRGPHSEEWKRKMVESRKGYTHSDETKAKLSASLSIAKSRTVTDGELIFNSTREAAAHYKVRRETVNMWILKRDNWQVLP